MKKLNFEQKIAIRVYIYFSLHCVFHASICVQLSKEPKTSIAFGFSQLHFLHRNRYYTITNMLEIKATILGEKRKWNHFFSLILGLPKDPFEPLFNVKWHKRKEICTMYLLLKTNPKLKPGTRIKLVRRRKLFCKTVSL